MSDIKRLISVFFNLIQTHRPWFVSIFHMDWFERAFAGYMTFVAALLTNRLWASESGMSDLFAQITRELCIMIEFAFTQSIKSTGAAISAFFVVVLYLAFTVFARCDIF